VNPLNLEVAIIGGGIAGLWLAARLRTMGYSVILLESRALGAGQTHCAQGIIHGGIKYALTGIGTEASEAIREMPARWRSCLEQGREIDLRKVRVLSEQQYLWSTESLSARMAGFVAAQVMRSRMHRVAAQDLPPVFSELGLGHPVYCLDEQVLDVDSLLACLAAMSESQQCKISGDINIHRHDEQAVMFEAILADGQHLPLLVRHLIYTAGTGNEVLQGMISKSFVTQRRPLRMVMVKGGLPEIFGHAIQASSLPRITLTSHFGQLGERVWYIGGQLAEDGVERSDQDQCDAARQELKSLMQGLDVTRLQFASFLIDRAEPKHAAGARPSKPMVKRQGRIIAAWPVKLAFAPLLADQVIEQLDPPKGEVVVLPDDLPRPGTKAPPWREVQQWN